MGIGFTIDTPLKVAPYGIDSVIFIGDDMLLEKLRQNFCEKNLLPYQEINTKEEDFKAKRVTAYLNLIKILTENKFKAIKNSLYEESSALQKYFEMLPDSSILKKEFRNKKATNPSTEDLQKWISEHLILGDINVNIMTKLDKINYSKGKALPDEYNDAHAAFRGFANSNLNSSLVLSAGMNPKLFSYIERFDDFYPNEKGEFKKKIILKVSDYRSALIQGKFLAKKGIWVSEYRIESGLNCGGHAFATEGYLMGPILEEFKANKQVLIESTYQLIIEALKEKGKIIPHTELTIRITAQGGIGNSEEHLFLLNNYGLDSIGWGSPFLLVPEVTNVDATTLKKLQEAKEKDLYLSNVSPLGVPFHNLRGNTKDIEKIESGKPGSKCPKEILALNSEFTERTICTASRQYQRLKIKELDQEKSTISELAYTEKYNSITEKSCLCVGLGTSALLVNNIEHKVEGPAVSICPGPNIAYYSKESSLQETVNHIYGKGNIIERTDRPMVFIKELSLYLDYFQQQIEKTNLENLDRKKEKYLSSFGQNLKDGIDYYHSLFLHTKNFTDSKDSIFKALKESEESLSKMNDTISNLMANKN